jgi:hypothetical protein
MHETFQRWQPCTSWFLANEGLVVRLGLNPEMRFVLHENPSTVMNMKTGPLLSLKAIGFLQTIKPIPPEGY